MSVDFLPFLAISVLLIVMPGPDTAVVTKNALMGGRRSGIYCAFGVAIGLTVWTVAAAVGLAALLQASAVAFLVLKIAGAIYLVWIGIQMLRARGPAPRAGRRRRPARRTRGGGRCGKACWRPREPEDRRLLHELPAAVRRTATARCFAAFLLLGLDVRRDHAGVARGVRRGSSARVGRSCAARRYAGRSTASRASS